MTQTLVPKTKSRKPLRAKTTRETASEPDAGLTRLIRLANMVPPDASLPHFPDLDCVALGSRYFGREEKEFARFLDENFPRDKFAEFRQFLDEGVDDPFPMREMYTFVVETREALRMIVNHQKERSLFSVTFHFPWERLGEWDISRLRICENCARLYLANRRNKLTCSETCSTTRRVRQWRKHQSQYEYARKLRLARYSKDTNTKTQKRESSSRKHGSQGGKNVTQKTR
jgi:hypothetical protein